MDKRRGDVAKMKFMLHPPLLSLYLHPLPLAFWHMAAHCACCAAILFAAISHFPPLFFFWGHKTEKWNAAWSSSSSWRNYAHWAFLLVLKFSAFSTWHLAMDFPRAWWIALHALSLAKVWWLTVSQQKSLLLLKKMFVCGFLMAVWHKSTFLVEYWEGAGGENQRRTVCCNFSISFQN